MLKHLLFIKGLQHLLQVGLVYAEGLLCTSRSISDANASRIAACDQLSGSNRRWMEMPCTCASRRRATVPLSAHVGFSTRMKVSIRTRTALIHELSSAAISGSRKDLSQIAT